MNDNEPADGALDDTIATLSRNIAEAEAATQVLRYELVQIKRMTIARTDYPSVRHWLSAKLARQQAVSHIRGLIAHSDRQLRFWRKTVREILGAPSAQSI